MSDLTINATGKVFVHSVLLYLSVSKADGSPVQGLTASNFAVKLAYGVSPDQVLDVATTFTYPQVDGEGNPVLDDNGDAIQQTVSLIWPQGLPGFYAMSAATSFSGTSANLQIRVQANGDQGQTIVASA